MACLLVCTRSDEFASAVENACRGIGWTIERGSLGVDTVSRIMNGNAGAVVIDLSAEQGNVRRAVDALSKALPFCPLILAGDESLIPEASESCMIYHLQPGRFEDLEHIVISLNCAGFFNHEELLTTGDAGGNAPRILLVDDDKGLSDALAHAFRASEEFDVEVAHSGFQAGAFLTAFQPDVAIIDIALGDMDGREVCDYLRGNDAFRNTKVIGVSGNFPPEVIEQEKDRFDLFMAKPFSVKELLRHVRAFLD